MGNSKSAQRRHNGEAPRGEGEGGLASASASVSTYVNYDPHLFAAVKAQDSVAVNALLSQGPGPRPGPGLHAHATARARAHRATSSSSASSSSSSSSPYPANDCLHFNGDTTLMWAAELGNQAIVSELLRHKADVLKTNDEGLTALAIAAKFGHTSIVSTLLTHRSDVNKSNSHGNTALIFAASNNHHYIVSELLAHGADVAAEDKYGSTALTLASWNGYHEITGQLLAFGADPNRKEKKFGYTPLIRAAWEGYTEIVAMLLAHDRVDVNAQGDDGSSALDYATLTGRTQVVRDLLIAGAVVHTSDCSGNTALHYAAAKGYHDIAAMLLSPTAANVHAANNDGNTPLHQAALNWVDLPPFTNMVTLCSVSYSSTVSLLLAHKADVLARNQKGDTALGAAYHSDGAQREESGMTHYKALTELIVPELIWCCRLPFVTLIEGCAAVPEGESDVVDYLLDDLVVRDICCFLWWDSNSEVDSQCSHLGSHAI